MQPIFLGFLDELVKLSRPKVRLIGKWTSAEHALLKSILDLLPSVLVHENKNLRAIARAPKLTNGPPDAPGHSMYTPNHPSNGASRGVLVLFDKGVYDSSGTLDPVLMGKSVLHELSHSLNVDLPQIFGRPPYITEYASRDASEDWAESFAEFFLHPKILRKRAPEKYRAIAKFVEDSR